MSTTNIFSALLLVLALAFTGVTAAATPATENGVTHEFLDKFPLEPGQTRIARVTLTENGFRYRCPINPTPWYEVGVSK